MFWNMWKGEKGGFEDGRLRPGDYFLRETPPGSAKYVEWGPGESIPVLADRDDPRFKMGFALPTRQADVETIYEVEIDVLAEEIELLEGAYDLSVELGFSEAALLILDDLNVACAEWLKARAALLRLREAASHDTSSWVALHGREDGEVFPQ